MGDDIGACAGSCCVGDGDGDGDDSRAMALNSCDRMTLPLRLWRRTRGVVGV